MSIKKRIIVGNLLVLKSMSIPQDNASNADATTQIQYHIAVIDLAFSQKEVRCPCDTIPLIALICQEVVCAKVVGIIPAG